MPSKDLRRLTNIFFSNNGTSAHQNSPLIRMDTLHVAVLPAKSEALYVRAVAVNTGWSGWKYCGVTVNVLRFRSTANGSANPAVCMLVTSLGDEGQLFITGACMSVKETKSNLRKLLTVCLKLTLIVFRHITTQFLNPRATTSCAVYKAYIVTERIFPRALRSRILVKMKRKSTFSNLPNQSMCVRVISSYKMQCLNCQISMPTVISDDDILQN